MSRDLLADAARRHAHALPGHTLLAAEPCGIPASVLAVDVLAEQTEELEAAQKYTLRAMLHGISTVEDLQLFLGLGEGDTARAVAGLLNAEYIDYRPPAEGEARRLQLLPAGQEAARDAQLRRPKSTSIPVVYDRLAGAVTVWRRNALRRLGRTTTEAARMLLPPAVSRPVETLDLSVVALTSTLDPRSRDGIRILGVNGVTENRTFSHDAILLVFKDLDSNTLRLGLDIDGVWSEPHAAALEHLGAVERLGLSIAPVEKPYESVAEPGERLSKDEVIALQEAAETGGNGNGRDEKNVLDRTAIRWLGSYEHPQWLDEAVTTSRHRLLIVSPQIRRTVVTDQWVRRLETLSRTAYVTIFWGNGANEQTDTEAVNALHAAARRSSRLAIVRVDEADAKVLVSDDFHIRTSFDWLSFRGEPSRVYRLAEGDLVQDRQLTDRAYTESMTTNCAAAVEVTGTLPPEYRDLVGSGAVSSTRNAASGQASRQARPRMVPAPEERRRQALKNLTAGQTVSGRVKSLTAFGAFVDLGDVDGLIHNTQLAARPVRHPSEVVSVGETVTVVVLDVDETRQRVSLSLKAATAS